MLSETIREALNSQITKEFYASQLYLAMSAHFTEHNLKGFAHWMRLQSEEEREHALRIFDYVLERGAAAELGAVDAPPAEFGSPVDVFAMALEHEKKVTASIHNIYTLALKENDYPTQIHLQWFIAEQVEEEANAGEMIERLRMAGDSGAALLMLDGEVKGRSAD